MPLIRETVKGRSAGSCTSALIASVQDTPGANAVSLQDTTVMGPTPIIKDKLVKLAGLYKRVKPEVAILN